jgi:hypothetical protein
MPEPHSQMSEGSGILVLMIASGQTVRGVPRTSTGHVFDHASVEPLLERRL